MCSMIVYNYQELLLTLVGGAHASNVNFNSSQWLLMVELIANSGRPMDGPIDSALCSTCH